MSEKKRFVRTVRKEPTGSGNGLVVIGDYTQEMKDIEVLLEEIRMTETKIGTQWDIELIEMTQEEYDKLPEFQGY